MQDLKINLQYFGLKRQGWLKTSLPESV